MSRRKRNASRRLLLGGVLFFVFVALFPPGASAHRCTAASKAPGRLTLYELRDAVQCLVNAGRERHGLAPLSYNLDLRRSATRHSTDMVSEHYFGHDGPHGRTVVDRVARAGYLGGVRGYTIGENIGGGVGRAFGSPLGVYRAWMCSPPHRENILDPDFHDLGVGVARGFPSGGGLGGATYTLDFGSRD